MSIFQILKQLGVLTLSISLISTTVSVPAMANDLSDIKYNEDEFQPAEETISDNSKASDTISDSEVPDDIDTPMLATATSGTCGDDLTWEFDSGNETLTISGTGDMYNYASYNDVPFHSVAGTYHVRKLVISDGVTSIGDWAFYCFDGLNHIEIADSVTSIGKYAFSHTGLNEIIIPSNITSIGDAAFWGCSDLYTIEIPDGVKSIGNFAFSECAKLNNLKIPGSVTSIGKGAFSGWNLTDIFIYSKQIELAEDVIVPSITEDGSISSTITVHGYDNIKEYVESLNNPNIVFESLVTTLGGKCGDNLTWEFDSGNGTLTISGTGDMYSYYNSDDLYAPWYDMANQISSVVLSDGITYIGDFAFYMCKNINSISIPSSVTAISQFAFFGCSNLTSIEIPDNVADIGLCAFGNCTSLTTIKLPDSLSFINSSLFSHCSSLTNINIPNNVKAIGNEAFRSCSNLSSVTIPESVTNIASYAFGDCISLKSIVIPSSVTKVYFSAFSKCTELKDIYIYSKQINLDEDAIVPEDEQIITVHGYDNIKEYVESLNNTGIIFKSLLDVNIITQPETVYVGLKSKAVFSINAENVSSYQWQYSKDGTKWYNSTASGAKTDTLTVTVSSTNYKNIYRCKVTGTNSDIIYSGKATVNLIPGAKITAQPSSVCIISGEKAKFTVDADNAVAYQWYYSKDGGTTWYKSTSEGAATDTLSITASNSKKDNQYRCKITGTDGNAINSSKVGIVIIAAQPQNSNAKIGATATFTVTADEYNPIDSYKWYYSKDSGETWYTSTSTGADTASLSVKTASSNRTNLYRCKVTNSAGISGWTSSVGFVDIADVLKITEQPESVAAAVGDKVSFTVKAENAASYQWYYSKNGTAWYKSTAVGCTTDTLTMTVSSSTKANQYKCKITGTDGTTVTTDVVTVD